MRRQFDLGLPGLDLDLDLGLPDLDLGLSDIDPGLGGEFELGTQTIPRLNKDCSLVQWYLNMKRY